MGTTSGEHGHLDHRFCRAASALRFNIVRQGKGLLDSATANESAVQSCTARVAGGFDLFGRSHVWLRMPNSRPRTGNLAFMSLHELFVVWHGTSIPLPF